MKLTCVTAVFNAIRSGNRERLIRCVESVAALKTEHEHLIYDGASTDGTVELLRELEREINGAGSGKKVGGESRSTADVLSSSDAEGILRLRVVSEPDTGIYNALNKGVRDAQGEWFYVLGCDDYIEHPEVVDQILADVPAKINMVATPVKMINDDGTTGTYFPRMSGLKFLFLWSVCNHQGILMRTKLVRDMSGFDERYTISADTNMFLVARFRHEPIWYQMRQFAVFTHGGTADNSGKVYQMQDRQCVAEALRLTDRQFEVFKIKGSLPFSVCAQYFFDSDYAIRLAARYMFWLRLKPFVRFLLYPVVVMTRTWRYGNERSSS